MSENADKAEAMFRSGFNCAQSVLACCGGPRGVPRELAIRLAGPLGGGIGATGKTCGAVTGALMALGLKAVSPDPKDGEAKQKVYALTREFLRQFRERNGHTDCRDLVGIDLSTPEGRRQFKEANLTVTICVPLIRSAAEIVEEMLSDLSGEDK